MAVPRKRLPIYFALGAICLVALALDRFLRSTGPKAVVAQEVASPPPYDKADNAGAGHGDEGSSTVATHSAKKTPDNPSTPIPRKPFPPGVQTWEANDGIRDLFRTATSESEALHDGNSLAASSALRKIAGQAASFPGRHNLQAVMLHPTLDLVIIDGRTLRKGDVVDGCTLARIEARRVGFLCPDGNADLELGVQKLPGD